MGAGTERPMTEDDLLGAWECFKGDGIHGWAPMVVVFRRKAGRILVEYWRPNRRGTLRRLCTRGGECKPHPEGLELRLRDAGYWAKWKRRDVEVTIMIVAAEGGTFLLYYPGTTGGGLYFRRRAWRA